MEDVVGPLTGDLNGVLNGERKGLESVCDAVSMRRRLAAGVDILIEIKVGMLVLWCKSWVN